MVRKKEIVELKRKLADISSAAAFTVTIKGTEVKVDKHDWDRLMDTIYGDINESLPEPVIVSAKKRPDLVFPPEYYENIPKCNESRLLTNEEVHALPKPIPLGDGCYDLSSFVNALKIAQDAKTASVLKEYEQARVERIFQEIENLSLMLLRFDVDSNSYTERPLKNTVEWQALKKQRE